ncbi:hypothetical protein ASC68_19530 [Devosia sp. Root105]|nr:hypothetical protein ASC68_19530 [Devosia sp. Root105]
MIVDYREINTAGVEVCPRFADVGRQAYLMSQLAKGVFDVHSDHKFVFDDENAFIGSSHFAALLSLRICAQDVRRHSPIALRTDNA